MNDDGGVNRRLRLDPPHRGFLFKSPNTPFGESTEQEQKEKKEGQPGALWRASMCQVMNENREIRIVRKRKTCAVP
jgi:hypothetical protein